MRENDTKIENLVAHFAQKEVLLLGKKKLAKLLYFVDFTNFELHGKSVTGMMYKKMQYGPMPATFYKHLDRLQQKKVIDIGKPSIVSAREQITALKHPDYSVFTTEEMAVINQVTGKFKNDTATMVEAAAKQEPPYKMVKANEEIPYHLAYYRNSFDEISLDENISA